LPSLGKPPTKAGEKTNTSAKSEAVLKNKHKPYSCRGYSESNLRSF
jgi:hypothetical protein